MAGPHRIEVTRICAHEGCTTRLSGYNPSDKCWNHQEPELPHTFGHTGKIKPVEPLERETLEVHLPPTGYILCPRCMSTSASMDGISQHIRRAHDMDVRFVAAHERRAM